MSRIRLGYTFINPYLKNNLNIHVNRNVKLNSVRNYGFDGLKDLAKQNISDAYFSGPLALDLILSKKSKGIKGLSNDPVAGFADGIIVPEIVSGNTLFKSMVYMTGACAGGIVVGGKVPILLTSRADSSAARLSSVSLASIWSNAS